MAKVVLVEAGPRILANFPKALSDYAQRTLNSLRVEVRVGAPVTGCDCDGVMVGGKQLEARTILWAAGVQAPSVAAWTGAEADRAGRVLVTPGLTLPGHDEVFVIGDAAHVDAGGRPLPGLAAVAKQQGHYVGAALRRRLAGEAPPPPFRYRDAGSLATIGRQAAVAAIGRLNLTGGLAWLLWSAVHVYFLIGFRNRIAVTVDWAWAYATFDRGARLITGARPMREAA
jgi:NADH dehydrogenase